MNNGPLPTTIAFLSSLPSTPPGSKVRFLGCVTNYKLSSATLSLQHAYPSTESANVIVLVEVSLLLEHLKRDDTEVGAWVNVMGYVEGVVGNGKVGKRALGGGERGDDATVAIETVQVRVKAVMLWSAGGVKIGEYENALEERLRAQGVGS